MAVRATPSQQAKRNHDRVVREIASSYKRRGYSVTIEPDEAVLPAFLTGFQPDIIATAANEAVVVEIKKEGKTNPERWRILAENIHQQPGWRLDLVVPDPEDFENFRSLTSAEIGQRLQQVSTLVDTGLLDAAYITAWSAAEAALRIMKEREGIEMPDTQPGTLIARLYTDGSLEREDYNGLMKALRLRNAVSHGYQRKVQAKDVAYLQNIVQRVVA